MATFGAEWLKGVDQMVQSMYLHSRDAYRDTILGADPTTVTALKLEHMPGCKRGEYCVTIYSFTIDGREYRVPRCHCEDYGYRQSPSPILDCVERISDECGVAYIREDQAVDWSKSFCRAQREHWWNSSPGGLLEAKPKPFVTSGYGGRWKYYSKTAYEAWDKEIRWKCHVCHAPLSNETDEFSEVFGRSTTIVAPAFDESGDKTYRYVCSDSCFDAVASDYERIVEWRDRERKALDRAKRGMRLLRKYAKNPQDASALLAMESELGKSSPSS